MVDGVHGHLDHVVRHVVEEYRIILECVIILTLHVEGNSVKVLAFIPTRNYATPFAAQVNCHC